MTAKMTALLTVIVCTALGQTKASAQEFIGQGALVEALSELKFQKGSPALPAQPADALKVIPRGFVPPQSDYPVRGIDVSHYQGVIDWSKVKGTGLSFVYIKATEGTDRVDEKFLLNWQGAARAGLRRGAYHFYDFCQKGGAQALRFVKVVPADGDSLPAAIDLEASKSCKTMPSKAAIRKSLAAFVKQVEKAYGKTPAIYVNANYYDKYFKGENDPYPVWITDAQKLPYLSDFKAWTFWQFSYKGTVPGIPAEVDMDVFNGGPEMFASLDAPKTASMMLADAN
jgi:lysozyme